MNQLYSGRKENGYDPSISIGVGFKGLFEFSIANGTGVGDDDAA